jgi:toxin ParE1/3/4
VIVRWSPLAIDRVVEIGEWIASERPAAASRIVDALFDAAERLDAFPLRGRRVPEFDERTDLREIFSNNSALSTRSPKRTSTFSQFGTCCS